MANTLAESGVIRGSLTLPVYYEDTDLSGFVYHANYLKFFERAREHVIGIRFLADLYDEGMHFVVNRAQLDFRSPARHGDQIVVESSGNYSRSPVIAFEQNAYVLEADGTKRLAVSGQISIVVLNADHRPIRMPDLILAKFAEEGQH